MSLVRDVDVNDRGRIKITFTDGSSRSTKLLNQEEAETLLTEISTILHKLEDGGDA